MSCDEDMLSLGTLTTLILSKQLLPVQEISTAYTLPELLLHHLLSYTLSLFFSWKSEKWNILMLFSFPKLKLLQMFAGIHQYQSIFFSEV